METEVPKEASEAEPSPHNPPRQAKLSATPQHNIMDIDRLFQYYYRPLCLYALHFLGNVDRAEDAVQDCFVSLLEQEQATQPTTHGSNLQDLTAQKAWLYRAVHNHCIDQLRRDRQLAPTIPLEQLAATAVDESLMERSFDEARLWTAIDSLPTRCREVLLLSKRDNMTYRAIAQRLGISERTVEHHLAKALRMLRGKAEFILRMLLTLG